MTHHLDALPPAQSLVRLPLWEVILGSAVGSQLDGLLRRRLVGLVQLVQLLHQQPLIVAQVSSCPLVARFCQCKRQLVSGDASTCRDEEIQDLYDEFIFIFHIKTADNKFPTILKYDESCIKNFTLSLNRQKYHFKMSPS